MCKSAIVVTVVLLFPHTNADSGEDPQAFTYYAPSTLNFHDIYANNLALLTGDTSSAASILKDDDTFHLGNLPSQFVEFHPQTLSVSTSTTVAPKCDQKSTLESNDTVTASNSTLSTSTTEQLEELTIKVIPISKKKSMYQRGVLDLLFPATRVKNFKSVFDTVRRLLSHTF